jgi:hypothetical protein
MIDRIFEDASMPWAIDMDGTLIREDVTFLVLYKSLRNPLLWHYFIFSLLLWGSQSFEHGQRFLESRLRLFPDPKTLSYNHQLIDTIETHRKRGGEAIMATATHLHAARPIAKHVGIFDDVLGSDPPSILDMRAEEKARHLNEKFENGFIYAGNSADDLKVWGHKGCKGMFLVNCDPEVLQKAQQIPKPFFVVP